MCDVVLRVYVFKTLTRLFKSVTSRRESASSRLEEKQARDGRRAEPLDAPLECLERARAVKDKEQP
jgi:hypothetical protein